MFCMCNIYIYIHDVTLILNYCRCWSWFFMLQSGEADGGTLGSSRDNSDKSDDNEIEGEIMEITEDMVPA
jgi:hypothetical protein